MGALKSSKCSWGHRLAGDNLYVSKDGKKRECRKCAKRRAKDSKARRKIQLAQQEAQSA